MKLGVIGGLGPLASTYYYELLTRMCDVTSEQDHIEVILHSCPSIADRTSYILDHHKDSPLNALCNVAIDLQKQGVDYIAIPCVTAHYFYKELSESIDIPIIHLIEEVCLFLKRKHINCVGIMATDGTIESKLFQKELERNDIKWIVPSSSFQEDIMHIIYQNIKINQPIEMDHFNNASNDLFNQGAQMIILGCTELSIIKKEKNLDERFLDCMELLSAVALKKCGKELKEEYRYLINE